MYGVQKWPHGHHRKGRFFLKHPALEKFLPLYPFIIYEHCQGTKAREASCIEKVSEDSLSFMTFRFAYKWTDNKFVLETKKRQELYRKRTR